MKRFLALTAVISSLAVTSDANALTYTFLPSNGAFADGSFSASIEGLTGPSNVTVSMVVESNFSCTISSASQTGCAYQQISGGFFKPAGWFGPLNVSGAAPGILIDNANFGSQLGESNDDGFVLTMTPASNIISFNYKGLAGGAFATSVIFSLFVSDNNATAVALTGQITNPTSTDVPIPAALPLLAAGLTIIGAMSRRKKAA
jgi:hypothetical protein